MKRLIKQAEHDISNRDFAILIVDGEVFTGESHSLALNKFLKNNSEFFRKSNERFENNEIPDNINSLAFAHAVKENNKLGIYLETQTLKNISVNEAVKILKDNFPESIVYNDDVSELKKVINDDGDEDFFIEHEILSSHHK